MSAALAVATFGVLVFGGISLTVFLLPDVLRPGHFVLGGITGFLALLMYPWQILDTKGRR